MKVKLIPTVTVLYAVSKNPLTNNEKSRIPDLCGKKKGIHNSKSSTGVIKSIISLYLIFDLHMDEHIPQQ